MKKNITRIIGAVLLVLFLVSLSYFNSYYRSTERAIEALNSDDSVSVINEDFGYFLDGPGKDRAFIFYPGAMVDESAYASMMHKLSENGIDVFILKMPLHYAFLESKKADKILNSPEYSSYEECYVGGHSLGGAMAALYASENAERLSGVILLAAYPTKALDDKLTLISIYGSEDGVLNMEKVKEGRQYYPENAHEYEIDGGNHAQFGDYGIQKGDGEAVISASEQQDLSVSYILKILNQE